MKKETHITCLIVVLALLLASSLAFSIHYFEPKDIRPTSELIADETILNDFKSHYVISTVNDSIAKQISVKYPYLSYNYIADSGEYIFVFTSKNSSQIINYIKSL